jgi:hypothetical protein
MPSRALRKTKLAVPPESAAALRFRPMCMSREMWHRALVGPRPSVAEWAGAGSVMVEAKF